MLLPLLTGAVLAAATTPSADPALRFEFAPQAPAYAGLTLADFVQRFYPATAVEAGMSGSATLECRVGAAGRVAGCVITDESPPGFGFGSQSIRMTPQFRVVDAAGEAAPQGGRVRQTFVFSTPAPPPAPPR